MELKDIEIIINDKKSHTYNTQDLMEVFEEETDDWLIYFPKEEFTKEHLIEAVLERIKDDLQDILKNENK
jgi:hypothetical protein